MANTGTVYTTITYNGGISGLSIDPATGNLVIPDDVLPSNYYVAYQICEIASPTNCTNSYVLIYAPPTIVANGDNITLTYNGSGYTNTGVLDII